MWRRLLPILFGLSRAVNLAVLGAWGLHHLRGSCHRSPSSGREPVPLSERIGVGPARAAQVEATLERFRASMREPCTAIEARRRGLLDLLAADPPDPAAIEAARRRLLEAQGAAQERVVDHLLAMQDLLEPVERQRLFDLLRDHGGCSGTGRMLGMPGRRRSGRPGGDGHGTHGPCCR